MTEFLLRSGDIRLVLWHTALYGLATMLEDAGIPDVRLSWTNQMPHRPRITACGLTSDVVDEVVRNHAQEHSDHSWVQRDIALSNKPSGLMSPRQSGIKETDWSTLQDARHQEIDLLTHRHQWTDLRFLAALGEPCYWSKSRDKEQKIEQDNGASRWEMQPRNSGADFVKSRLRKLAEVVANRQSGEVSQGIAGTQLKDESGGDKPDSHTATGLAHLGPVDNAVVWCALWGIAEMPLAPRINNSALSTGHLGQFPGGWFYTPVWYSPWRPARLRSILAHKALKEAAAAGLPDKWASDPVRVTAARDCLAKRGVVGTVRFPIHNEGTDHSRKLLTKHGIPLATADRS